MMPADDFYSPTRVRKLLRAYDLMHDRKSAQDPELRRLLKATPGGASYWEEVCCRRADIAAALTWLGEQPGQQKVAVAVRLYYCVGLTYEEVAAALHQGVSTVWGWCRRGTARMAEHLGYVARPVAATAPRPVSPTVIRYFEE